MIIFEHHLNPTCMNQFQTQLVFGGIKLDRQNSASMWMILVFNIDRKKILATCVIQQETLSTAQSTKTEQIIGV